MQTFNGHDLDQLLKRATLPKIDHFLCMLDKKSFLKGKEKMFKLVRCYAPDYSGYNKQQW